MNRFLVIMIPLLCLVFMGCRKNTAGSGGKASISGYVEYQGNRVYRNTVVFIKYGASSFPGTDVSQYDSQQNVDAQGNYNFATMFIGSYYLYARGNYIDANGFILNLTGGIQVNITDKKQNLNYDIAVHP
ncbi:MAG TPA: hypothetical protein VF411_04420 [Bacteroidia bacterium]